MERVVPYQTPTRMVVTGVQVLPLLMEQVRLALIPVLQMSLQEQPRATNPLARLEKLLRWLDHPVHLTSNQSIPRSWLP